MLASCTWARFVLSDCTWMQRCSHPTWMQHKLLRWSMATEEQQPTAEPVLHAHTHITPVSTHFFLSVAGMYRGGITVNGCRWQISVSRWPTGSQPANLETAAHQRQVTADWTRWKRTHNGQDGSSSCFRTLKLLISPLWCTITPTEAKMKPILNSLWAQKASYFWFFFFGKNINPPQSQSYTPLISTFQFIIVITAHIFLEHLRHHREDGDWVGLAAALLPCRSGEI